MNTEFQSFAKIARLSREMIISEKLDGTNSQLLIEDIPIDDYQLWLEKDGTFTNEDAFPKHIRVMKVGSRNRWLTKTTDNFGFNKWVSEHTDELMQLGPGRHYGEWWGLGIQRGYGLKEKRFSLFNTGRWTKTNETGKEQVPDCCHVVPILYQGIFDTHQTENALTSLKLYGSVAAPGFLDPEGIVVFHVAGNMYFKKTLDNDALPKSLTK